MSAQVQNKKNTQVGSTTRCDEQDLDVMILLDETVDIGTRITHANDMMMIPVLNYGYHH